MYGQRRKYPQRAKLAAKRPRAAYAAAQPQPSGHRPRRAPGTRVATRAVSGRKVYSLARKARVVAKTRTIRAPDKHRFSKAKEMIEGPPTFLDQIASGVGQVANLARAVAPMIEMINTEAKFYDETSSSSFSNTGLIIALTDNVAQGTDENNRIGNSVLLKDMSIKLFLSHAFDFSTATSLGGYYRIIIFCWKENLQDNPPTVAKILQGSVFSSFTNKDYTDQFVVLKDKIIPFDSQLSRTSGVLTANFKFMKWYKKCDWHLRWDAGTGADGSQNHVHMLLIQSLSTGSNYTLNFRMNFTDN